MKKLLFIILVGVFFSCKNTQKKKTLEVQEPVKNLTKLEQLYLLPKDSIYEFYDLSNDSIKEFPDLSEYSIKKLDLSHNQINSLIIKKLPKNIIELDLSYNFLSGSFFLSDKTPKTLKKLNLSYNNISNYNSDVFLVQLSLNDNNLESVSLGNEKMSFLDISNNPKLSNEVYFDPKFIDTIIHHNIANNKKLIFYFSKPFVID